MQTTAEMLKARIADGRTVCNVGHWLPCASRWVRAAVKRGELVAARSGYPDGRMAYRLAEV